MSSTRTFDPARLYPSAPRVGQPVSTYLTSGLHIMVIYHRDHPDGSELAYYVEGDLTVYRYPTRELRDAATDCLAFWHWKHEDEDWVAGVDSVDVAPDHLRGTLLPRPVQRGGRV